MQLIRLLPGTLEKTNGLKRLAHSVCLRESLSDTRFVSKLRLPQEALRPCSAIADGMDNPFGHALQVETLIEAIAERPHVAITILFKV